MKSKSHPTKGAALDSNYSTRMEEQYYSKTDEKAILVKTLEKIFAGRTFKNALDIGPGPGHASQPIIDHSDRVTMLEILPEYEEMLKTKFPNAEIIIDSVESISLKPEYDLIVLSQVLFYIAEDKWFSICKKLYDALVDGGLLIVVLVNNSSDWWNIVNHFSSHIREHMRFDYIPLTEFKKTLQTLGSIASYPYSCEVQFNDVQETAHCIGNEILQISDKDILAKHRDDFEQMASTLEQRNGKVILHADAEVLVLQKTR